MRKQTEPSSVAFLRAFCEEKKLTLEIDKAITIRKDGVIILTGEIIDNNIPESCRQISTLIFTKYRKDGFNKISNS